MSIPTARLLTEKIDGLRRSRYRGRAGTRAAGFLTMAAFNLLRMTKLERTHGLTTEDEALV